MRLTKLETLNIIRKRKGLTLQKLSTLTGLTIGFLGNVVHGNYTRVSENSERKIARAIGVPVKMIFKKHGKEERRDGREDRAKRRTITV